MTHVNGATRLVRGPEVPKLQAPEDIHDVLRQFKTSRPRAPSSHPVNVVHHDEATPGERLADRLAATIGSWRFLIIQTAIVAVWVGLNLIGILRRWDPYPFILLAGNRQTQKDRLTLEHADREADHTSTRTLTILEEIRSNTELTVQVLGHVKTAHVANTNATG
ncbi:MAG: DUF1003 domain-containing protein [Chloroflexi bacterium]|nr:MAG: DUF1003 domain-containing protein [Chloroflexota bacterium]